jgi:nucleoside-triphosphatase
MSLNLSKKNLLLTGPPKVGKTTVIMAVCHVLGERADGFYTKELRERGRRKGFLLISLRGEEGLLAHVDLKHGPRVGRYAVNIDDIESIGVTALRRAKREGAIIIIDEIGRMELFSEAFKREVLRLLDSPSRVLATVREAEEPFCDSIKGREDVTVIRVSEGNRDALPEIILDELLKD